jgi:hypothetical protein
MPHDPDFDDDGDGDFTGTKAELAETAAPLSTRLALSLWKPEPLPEPDIDPDMLELPWPERSAEVTRHFVLSAERWVSPSGWLREWVRINVRLAVAFAATALLVVPTVSALLAGAADWTSLVAEAIGNTVGAAMKLPPVILGAIALVVLVRWLRSRRLIGRERKRQGHREDYDGYG